MTEDDLISTLDDLVSENAVLESQGGVRKNYQTRKCLGADALNTVGKTPPSLNLLAITPHREQDIIAKIDKERGETLPKCATIGKPTRLARRLNRPLPMQARHLTRKTSKP